MIDLDALEALEKAATPGPWAAEKPKETAMTVHWWIKSTREFPYREWICEKQDWHHEKSPPCLEDAELIAAARNALPALIRELRAARAVVKAAIIRNPLGEELFHEMLDAQKKLDTALAAYDATTKVEK